ncbi:glycine betaine ABC transporter substrate-binding protein [Sedimentibacter sp. MB31-C6]|uniref:glycine betaine ABC transporter substrate-binding protein n=1 Tax=Sedimentibacter sp. MB31-C6 TaxID=3109366 RepID=UPI002DDD768B|nr:glycine betaine ABC transporter substrate-binding protein [Sedimentibacter sp. MB36-C1]WSI02909.1 glycine betaine ABC transporter substrate-binding protein [Sedimentibacter sp. MB36-C1]
MKKFFTLMLAILMMVSIITGCSNEASVSKEPVNIIVTDNGWDSQKLHNEIAKVIVEHGYDGYTFETSSASSTMNWQAIITGDVDLDIESWTDNVASYPEDVANGDIIDVGILVPDSAQGLYVPRYVIEGDVERGIEPMAPDLKTVEDLKKYPDVFPDYEDKTKGRIYGSIPGWMADEVLYKKYEYYGLDEMFNYARLGSEATLFASLVSSYNIGEAWVGYCYEPTWVSGKLDLVLLEDAPYDVDVFMDGKCEFPKQELKIVSSNKFAEKAPDLLEFFKKYETGSQLIADALAYLDETQASHEETAKWLLKENDYLLDEWLPEENAEKVQAYLNE